MAAGGSGEDLDDLVDRVWSGALGGQASHLAGDRSMGAILAMHGLIMNGGVLHAVESTSRRELEAAGDAYRWLGFAGVAELLVRVRAAAADGIVEDEEGAEVLELTSDEEYLKHVRDDSALEAALRNRVATTPYMFDLRDDEKAPDAIVRSAALITRITLPLLVILLVVLIVGIVVRGPSVRLVLAISVVSLLSVGNVRRQLRDRSDV